MLPEVAPVIDTPPDSSNESATIPQTLFRRMVRKLSWWPWVVGLLAIYYILAVTATLEKCTTYDEPLHLTAGYSYWKFNDYRLQPENGNLPQRWAALPLLIEKPRLEPASEPTLWSLSHVWLISQRFLFETGNNTDFMLATARACMALWSVATGLLVFVWSRRLWGDAAGLFS